ncbi:MAG: YraN family protein [Cyanobacteria bacterium P01_F01_bin.153]
MPTSSHQSGVLGEAFVAAWLQQQSWELIAQRWRCRWGELDLVARSPKPQKTANKNQPHTLAFIEVKTRSRKNWDQDGLLALSPSKCSKLIRAAQTFLSEFPELSDDACRFDVAAVRCDRQPKTTLPLPDLIDLTHQCPAITPGSPRVIYDHRLTLQHYIPNAFDLG